MALYERLAIKIWQTVTERGIGGLLSPWQIRRTGKAHADVRRIEIQSLAQAHRDGLDILTGRKTLDTSGRLIEAKPEEFTSPEAGGPLATLPSKPAPLQLLQREQDCRELERAINIRETIAMAEEEASSVADENVSDEPVNPDWFARWRENAEDVQDDQMHRFKTTKCTVCGRAYWRVKPRGRDAFHYIRSISCVGSPRKTPL